MNRAGLPLNGIAFRGLDLEGRTPEWGVAFPTGPGPFFQASLLPPHLLQSSHRALQASPLKLGVLALALWLSELWSSVPPSPVPVEIPQVQAGLRT